MSFTAISKSNLAFLSLEQHDMVSEEITQWVLQQSHLLTFKHTDVTNTQMHTKHILQEYMHAYGHIIRLFGVEEENGIRNKNGKM